MIKSLSSKMPPSRTADACYCYCPRCHHAVRFQRAISDGAWVCQKCLRYRILAPDAKFVSVPREPAHA